MTTRKALLRAMVDAYFGPHPVSRDTLDLVRPGLLAALDAVEPQIRADERDQESERNAPAVVHLLKTADEYRTRLAYLRAKIEALSLMSDTDHDYNDGYEAAKRDVLDLFDDGEGRDEHHPH